MKKVTVLFLAFILFGICSAQDNAVLQDGYQVFKYPNGTVSSKGMIKNGKPEGFWVSYYVTGVKKSEGTRTNHLLDSIWVFYDQSGDTTKKISYLYGKKNGWYYEYKKEPAAGNYIWLKELYAGDVKEGVSTIFFPDGRVRQTIAYNNGKKEGLSKEFDKEGIVISLLEYHNDFLVSRDRINRKDNKNLKQGPWKIFYSNGRIKNEATYVDDLLNGYYKEYDEKGNLVLTMLYDKGAIVKSRVEDEPEIEISNKYDQNGKLIYSGPFRKNVPVGTHREYGPDGKVTNSFIYNDNGLKISEGIVDEAGNRNGKWKDFSSSGKIQAEGQFQDNRRSGQWKFYSDSGKVVQTGSFNAGRPDGIWKWYYDNGAVLREEEYFQGERDGGYIEYAPDGKVIAQGQYMAGEKNGTWKYNAGDYTEEGNYITGLKDGMWKDYYPNGKLKFKGNFVQGNPDGTQTFYYEDGRIKEEQNFENGIRQKTWKKYDEEGTIILAIAYRNDVEVSINGVRIKLPESDTKLIK
jgi:antitoxin component YwqK of YwqJK toxin-antitoxin module